MIVNVESIYAPYHWFLSIEMLNTYTASTRCTKDHEIQLRLPNIKFVMIPILEPLILNSHCTKQIVRKNVWKLNLETINNLRLVTLVFRHSYILDVQILSGNKLKISSPIWPIVGAGVVFSSTSWTGSKV